MTYPAESRLSELGMNYNFQEKNLYKLNPNTKFILKREIYYTWTQRCNDFYNIDINKEWEHIFGLIDPIEYQTTRGKIDEKEFKSVSEKKSFPIFGYVGYKNKKFSVPSGFVIPKFNFLSHKLNSMVSYHVPDKQTYNEDKKAYEQTKNAFSLNEGEMILIEDFIKIGDYRNLLLKQIERQANIIQNIHIEISEILKIYYYESERAIVKAKSNTRSKKNLSILEADWQFIKLGLTDLFQNKIQGGMDIEEITNEIQNKLEEKKNSPDDNFREYQDFEPFQLENSKYVPNKIHQYVLDGYYAYMLQKRVFMHTSINLADKLAPLESLLEDHYFNREIKTTTEYASVRNHNNLLKYQGDEYWKTAHYYYHNSDLIWEDVYKKMVKEMKAAGIAVRHTTYDSFMTNKSKYDKKN